MLGWQICWLSLPPAFTTGQGTLSAFLWLTIWIPVRFGLVDGRAGSGDGVWTNAEVVVHLDCRAGTLVRTMIVVVGVEGVVCHGGRR